MLRHDIELVESCDAILVLNFEKNGQPNYVGASAFLELFKAFELGKGKYILNPLPDNNYYDELLGINPVVINGDLSLINDRVLRYMLQRDMPTSVYLSSVSSQGLFLV